jgi:hypothetical protein
MWPERDRPPQCDGEETMAELSNKAGNRGAPKTRGNAPQFMSRRAALARLGFASTVVYMAPVLVTLSDARATSVSQSAASHDVAHGSGPSASKPSFSGPSG